MGKLTEIKREKFSTQMDVDVLAQLRGFAKSEGRQLQAILEEAVTSYLDEKKRGKVRPEVWAAYQKSKEQFSELYKKLAQ